MAETTAGESRFRSVLMWVGVVVAVLGLILIVRGAWALGLLVTVAGVIGWLFAKRRSRLSGSP